MAILPKAPDIRDESQCTFNMLGRKCMVQQNWAEAQHFAFLTRYQMRRMHCIL